MSRIDDAIIDAALHLYNAGLHVFPIKRASKEPFGRTEFLMHTRLHRDALPALCPNSNLAVMAGILSGNLLVLDCDSDAAFRHIGAELEALEIKPWIRNGARGGHYWLRVEEGEIVNRTAVLTTGDTIDILGRRKYAVAPPSIHPTGMMIEWIKSPGPTPPLVSIVELQKIICLQSKIELFDGKAPRKRISPDALPKVATTVLIRGDTSKYGGDNSRAEFAACLSLIGVGKTDSEILSIFETHHPPHFTKTGSARFIEYTLRPARERHAESDDAFRPYNPAEDFLHWAQKRTWGGRNGTTDRAVFLAMVERRRRHQGSPFRASVREVAELANVDKATAQRALKRLMATGVVQQAFRGANRSGHYVLTPPEEGQTAYSIETYSEGVRVLTVCKLSTDAFHPAALGKSAELVWSLLQRSAMPMSKPDIVTATGKCTKTIQRALQRLRQHAMAVETEGKWAAIDANPEKLDSVAEAMGTKGRSEARKTRHAVDRQRYASRLMADQIKRATSSEEQRQSEHSPPQRSTPPRRPVDMTPNKHLVRIVVSKSTLAALARFRGQTTGATGFDRPCQSEKISLT